VEWLHSKAKYKQSENNKKKPVEMDRQLKLKRGLLCYYYLLLYFIFIAELYQIFICFVCFVLGHF